MPQLVTKREQILRLVLKRGRSSWTTSAEISGRSGCSRGAAAAHLRRLCEEGLLERRKAFGGTYEFRVKADG